MSIYAELPDGRKLEFPNGTADEVVDATVQKEMGIGQPPKDWADKADAPGASPMSASVATSTTTTPESEKPGPGLGERIVEEIPQVGGGIVGGLTAAAAGIGAGAGIAGLAPVAGAVALGAAAGEAYKQIGQQLSGSLDAPKTSLEAFKRIGLAGVEEGAWEAIGGLAMKGVGKLLAPYKSKIVEGAGDVIEFFKDKIKPVVLLPGEATESRVLDLLQNVTESSIVGGNRIAEFKTARLKFFDDFADSMIDEFGSRTSPDDLGNLFVASVNQQKEVHSKAANVLYNNVSEILNNRTPKFKSPWDSYKAEIDATKAGKKPAFYFAIPDEDVLRYAKSSNLTIVEDITPSGDFAAFPKTRAGRKSADAIIKLSKQRQRIFDAGDEELLDEWNRAFSKELGYEEELANNIQGISGRGPLDLEKARIDSYTRVTVPTAALKAFAKHPRKLAEDLGGIEAKNAGDDLMGAIMDLPDTISFDAAKELRSRLISRVNEFSVLNKKAPAIGKAKKMIGIVDSAIEGSLKKDSPEALEAWRTANRFYKEGQKKFNNTMIRRLVKMADDTGTGSEMIAPAVFKPGQVSRVRKVKAALDPPEWRKMQGFFMQHLMSKSTNVDGSIVGKRLLNNISGKPNSFGEPMLKEILSPEQITSLKTFGRAVELSQAKQGEGAGKVLIQLTQAGAMGAVLTGSLELPAATVILGPAVLGKMLLRPSVARILTKGVSIPAKSSEAAGILARLVAASHRIEAEKEKP